MNKYVLHISGKSTNARFIITYKAGKFHKLERKAGKLNQKKWQWLKEKLVPLDENQIEAISELYSASGITYTLEGKKSTQSLYSKLLQPYWSFYEDKNEIPPRINAAEGKSLKDIISHLKKLSADEEEVLQLWTLILDKWDELEPFYQKQMELKQINSNINNILRQIKHGKGTSNQKRQARNASNDIRESL